MACLTADDGGIRQPGSGGFNHRAIFGDNLFFNPPDEFNMGHYRKLEQTHLLSQYEIVFPHWRGGGNVRRPFAPWGKNEGLPWWKAYNKSKHARHAAFTDARFEVVSPGADYDYPRTLVSFWDCATMTNGTAGGAYFYSQAVTSTHTVQCFTACSGEALGAAGIMGIGEAMLSDCVPRHGP